MKRLLQRYPTRTRLKAALLLFVLAILAWLLCLPERPDRVFRALPANTTFASEHIQLARVWRKRFDNPLLVRALTGFGVEHVGDWAADPNLVWIVRLVSGPRTLIAWSPSLGPSGKPCWTAASWVGARGRLLQAMLWARWVPGAGRLQLSAAGVPYLPMKSKNLRGQVLAFSLRENVLMATLGEDPDAVRTLDWRLTHDAPPAALFAVEPEPWRRTGEVPHRAWVDPAVVPLPLPALGIPGPIELRLCHIDDQRLTVSLWLPPNTGEKPPTVLAGRCAAADALASAGTSSLLAMLPRETVASFVKTRLPDFSWPLPEGSREVDDVCLTVSAHPYGGRLFNLAVPAVTLLLPWGGAESTLGADVAKLAEQVNRAFGTRLSIREPVPPVEGRLLVDWLGGGRRIQTLSDDACLVVERQPGWLTVCSSMASLEAQRAAVPDGTPAWRAGLDACLGSKRGAGFGARVYAWADVPAVTYEVRQVLAVHRLATALGFWRASPEEEAIAQGASDTTEALAAFGSVEAVWVTENGRTGVTCSLTAAEPTSEQADGSGRERR